MHAVEVMAVLEHWAELITGSRGRILLPLVASLGDRGRGRWWRRERRRRRRLLTRLASIAAVESRGDKDDWTE